MTPAISWQMLLDRSILQQTTQHIGQDAAVVQIVHLYRRINPQR
jgi:hypothetical protein